MMLIVVKLILLLRILNYFSLSFVKNVCHQLISVLGGHYKCNAAVADFPALL